METSKHFKGKKKKKPPDVGNSMFKLDLNKFSQELIEEINLLRTNPQGYAAKIQDHTKYITYKDGKFIYENGDMRFSLLKGHLAFSECIDYLNRCEKLPNMFLTETYRVDVPERLEDQMKFKTGLETLRKQFPEKNIELNIDITYLIPELIVTLQLVDDNKSNGRRRNNLLSPNYIYLGITLQRSKGRHFTVYLTFSN